MYYTATVINVNSVTSFSKTMSFKTKNKYSFALLKIINIMSQEKFLKYNTFDQYSFLAIKASKKSISSKKILC